MKQKVSCFVISLLFLSVAASAAWAESGGPAHLFHKSDRDRSPCHLHLQIQHLGRGDRRHESC